jgi:hypothetical protein
MRAPVLVSLAMIMVAAVSAATLIEEATLGYLHRIPYIAGVPDASVTSLRRIVPRGESLGFITDGSDRQAIDKRLYGLTYSLAPFIVENTPDRRFVIGDFQNRSDISVKLGRYRLSLVEDLGNGFLLLKAW